MPNGDPPNRFFYPFLTLMIDSYNLRLFHLISAHATRSRCYVVDKPLTFLTRGHCFNPQLRQSVDEILSCGPAWPYDLSCWWDVKLNHTHKHTQVLYRLMTQYKLPTSSQSSSRERSGSVLDLRPRGRRFEPHRCHYVVVLDQDKFILS